MKLKKIITSTLLVVGLTSLIFTGCTTGEKTPDAPQEETEVENGAQEEGADLNYSIEKEVVEIEDKNIKVFYPQIKDYPGELTMDYMNQSLKKIADLYGNKEMYSDVEVDYEITKMDKNILSVLFVGKGKVSGEKEITIKQSVNLDIASSNEIDYNNFVKSDDESKEEVMKILNEKAKAQGIENGVEAEGIRIYFKDDNVVFYYMPLDDSASEFIELTVPMEELEGHVNTEFGEHPAS